MKQKLSKFEQNIAIYEQMVKDEQKAAVKLLKCKIKGIQKKDKPKCQKQ